jgi:acyl-CoA synthetase (AMP-forming)/AMP-acid ligase II
MKQGEPTPVDDLPPFRPIADLLREHASARPMHPAIVQGDSCLTWAELDQRMNQVAASFQRDGLVEGDSVVLCGGMTPWLAVIFLGALRAGLVVAPLAYSVTPATFAAMLQDANPKRLFVDEIGFGLVLEQYWNDCVAIDAGAPCRSLESWLEPGGVKPRPVELVPESPFNIIYSSGTTGIPKGIVQPHGMRWQHIHRGSQYRYSASTVTLLSTPLYSNTTLVVFFPTLGFGGTVHLMAKFDAGEWLRIAARERVTHTMLVPVQYRRLMAHPQFDAHDLSAFQMKFCTSAPFAAEIKADVLRRWPGGLVEFYGMTEGGGTCILEAHLHPDKLHTVGPPAAGHDLRLIDEEGLELPAGEPGEVVGRSPAMMIGYHNQPEKTQEAEWFSPDGLRFIRTGDIGRFDPDGFMILLDRKKDMIISGGFNLYPSDLESVLCEHPAVQEAAVVGVPSVEWGETPVAFVVRRLGAHSEDILSAPELSAPELRDWVNTRVGKTQRLSGLRFVQELPRSAIGKVLKRELREMYRENV